MKVYIKTPARLHFGLIDTNGELGRLFGGLGLGIDRPNVVLEAEPSQQLTVTGEKTDLVTKLATKFLKTYNIQNNVSIHVQKTIPDHVGLGSGTQLSLAVATALNKIFGTNASLQELAATMGRAQRTGVGTTIFEQGGFVVDGGKLTNTNAPNNFPPVIFQQPFPEDWQFIVAIPNSTKGLSNDQEKQAFKHLPPMAPNAAGKICHLIVMKLLPALVEHDIKHFGEALTQVQEAVGDNFTSVQGGRYSSDAAADTLAFLKKQGAFGVGQSSWGPAVYGLFQEKDVGKAETEMKNFLGKSAGGEAFAVKPNNTGAYIRLSK